MKAAGVRRGGGVRSARREPASPLRRSGPHNGNGRWDAADARIHIGRWHPAAVSRRRRGGLLRSATGQSTTRWDRIWVIAGRSNRRRGKHRSRARRPPACVASRDGPPGPRATVGRAHREACATVAGRKEKEHSPAGGYRWRAPAKPASCGFESRTHGANARQET